MILVLTQVDNNYVHPIAWHPLTTDVDVRLDAPGGVPLNVDLLTRNEILSAGETRVIAG